MCTVSFYHNNNTTIITSNRDEHTDRPLAHKPKKIELPNGVIYAPIDPQSNGTWIGIKQSGAVFVLLNGAKKKHTSTPPYLKSRGRILIELLDAVDFEKKWKTIPLIGIEPFTLIVYYQDDLYQLYWNGKEKSGTKLLVSKAYIWSSSTLYAPAVKRQREKWFAEFLNKNTKEITGESLWHFHRYTQANNPENGLVINRNNKVKTKNITQCVLNSKSITMKHLDLISQEETTFKQAINQSIMA